MEAAREPQPGTSDTGDPGREDGGRGGAMVVAVRAVSGVTLVSRLGGLARDVLVSRLFGDTALGSAFAAGFAIPNLFRRLFGEGALSAAFIPEYTDSGRAGRDESDRLASLTVWTLGVGTGLLTAVAEVALLLLAWLLPPDEARLTSIRLIMVMLPFMPFICVTAILGGMLQVHGRFAAAASGPLVLNGFIIAVGLWHVVRGERGSEGVAYALGLATTLSGLTQAAAFAWLLRRKVSWRSDWGAIRPRARRMWTRLVPVLIGLGALQINTLMDQVIAMWPIWFGPTILGVAYPLDERSNILIAAAQRLYQFPLGVFGIAVATAVFPMLARDAGDTDRFGSTLRRGVRLSFFIGFPAGAGLMLVGHDLVATLFSSGPGAGGEAREAGTGFSASGVGRTAAVVMGFAPAIWAYSVNHVLARAFYARGDTRTPMRVSLAMVALNLVLNITLIWPLREAGLAWSTSLCAMIQCAILAVMCRRRLGTEPLDAASWPGLLKTVGGTAVMAAAVWTLLQLMPEARTWADQALRVAIGTGVGIAAFTAWSAAMRSHEFRWLIGRRTDA